MCGILGKVVFDAETLNEASFEVALLKLKHRGPDDSGIFSQNINNNLPQHLKRTIQFGHRRLSIFDMSSAGRQPMGDEKGRRIVYNGEIFNWPELKAELQEVGYRFATNTDTEVILAGYDYWGADCVKRFNGFWALAIFDAGNEKNDPAVFLSRDRFGIKPFYYYYRDKVFIFCSEIVPIHCLLGQKPAINAEQLARYLILDLSHDNEKTLYQDILELEPGHSAKLNLENGSFKIDKYWSLPQAPDLNLTDNTALDTFSDLLEDAVRIRLRADREVALTLSGGTDSSAIAVAASRVTRGSIRAFTSHFPEHPEIEESHYAEMVAQKCGFEHELVQPELYDLDKDERELTKHQELMYVNFSVLVNWAVQRKIRSRNIALTLTGQGGDELFLGYERYLVPNILSNLKNPARFVKEIFGSGKNSRLGILGILMFIPYFAGSNIRSRRYLQESRQIFKNDFVELTDEKAQNYPFNLRQLQYQQICGEQLRRLLRYDDRTSGAFGMESRPAMLDYRLVEFAYRLPWRHKIRNGWTKYIVRRYLEKAGLPEIAWRKQKLGFNAPTDQWANSILKIRGESIFNSAFAGSILKSNVCAEKLTHRSRFKVLNLLSSAELLKWKALSI